MSFVQRSTKYGGLVRDSFPNHVARNAQEDVEQSSLAAYLVVPNTKDSLFDWAKVVSSGNRDISRRHELVYKKCKSGTPMLSRVSLRIYGFLGVNNLSTYGNWDGDEMSAAKATTFLKLEPGCFAEQYAEQMQALDDIRYMIVKSLPGYREQRRLAKQDMFIQRRVFRKMDGHTSKQNLLPTDAADLESRAQSIAKKWMREQGADYGRKSESGRILQCDPLVFNPGDLVDVQVTFDIVTAAKGPYKTVTIHISPSQVVRLARAEVFMKVTAQPSTPMLLSSAAIVVSEDKLVFDVEGGQSGDEESSERNE